MSQKRFSIFLTTLLVVILSFPIIVLPYQQFIIQETAAQDASIPYTVATYGNAWNGTLAFGLNGPTDYLVIMKTDGTLITTRTSSTTYGVVKNIAQDALIFQGEPQTTAGGNTAPTYVTHIWNVATNTTQDYPNVIGHHDIEYDPINNTFLTFQSYIRQIGNNAYLFDKIIQLDTTGNVLWTWDTYNYIPISEADPFNLTGTFQGQEVIDFTHCNTLVWDYNNSVIYLNVRHTNTFYEINQTTSNVIWACGQFGNFTLLDQNGSQVPSLWYHSHDLKKVGPYVFTMFNNDFDNITNYNDSSSQLIEVTLNEQNMTAYVNWSWTAPSQYYSTFLGANLMLPNGDWLGDFGSPTHQFVENQPWNFNDTGAVLVEVNPAGQIVRTITFPTGRYIYRVEQLTNLSPNAFSYIPTTTPTPQPTQIQSPTTKPSPTRTQTPSPTPSPNPTTTPTATATNTPTPTPPPPANSLFIPEISALIIASIIVVLSSLILLKRKRKKNHP